MNLVSLLKDTESYKIISNDKKLNRLSHAYLIVSEDKRCLSDYLRIFAKFFFCESATPCDNCRACRLIDENALPDLLIYPLKDGKITTDTINEIIEKSFYKPIECDKKLFIIENAQDMSAVAQNKLLKTLEEPPENTYILIGTTSEFPILPTVLSRVKKLKINAFPFETLFSNLKDDFFDHEKLKTAIACSDGTVGKVISLYEDKKLNDIENLVVDIIVNMQSSANILEFINKIDKSGIDLLDLLSVLELTLRDLLLYYSNKEELVFNNKVLQKTKTASGYNAGSIIYALEKINEAKKRKTLNISDTAIKDWLLFAILEGKHKWQK